MGLECTGAPNRRGRGPLPLYIGYMRVQGSGCTRTHTCTRPGSLAAARLRRPDGPPVPVRLQWGEGSAQAADTPPGLGWPTLSPARGRLSLEEPEAQGRPSILDTQRSESGNDPTHVSCSGGTPRDARAGHRLAVRDSVQSPSGEKSALPHEAGEQGRGA